MEFETVIGLEVHVQLNTKSKIFCSCSTEFGAEPNTHVCPVCMGLPGALPMFNREVLRKAILAGLALNCDIQQFSQFDRKSYFYPDLPKAYQTTQLYHPICLGGYLEIEKENGERKRLHLTRIHIEEDAGKLVHGESIGEANSSYVDLNRSSMPLVEIVSEPEMRSAEEARLYMQKIRSILTYAGVSDGNMEEGSLRCDANVSIRPVGQKEFGTRVEIKNMNSFRNVQRAIEYEIQRQEETIRSGGKIVQETRLWDNNRNITQSMRTKEDADDYRYFPCPDLLAVMVSKEEIDDLRKQLPEMPDSRKERFMKDFGLSQYDAELLTSDIKYAVYFEEALKYHNSPKQIANWMMSELLRAVNDRQVEINEVGVTPEGLAGLVKLVEDGVISGKQGKEVFVISAETKKAPADVVKEKGMAQVSDMGELEVIVQSVIDSNPTESERFRNGDKKLMGFFVGQVMKTSGGKANPKLVNEIINKLLS